MLGEHPSSLTELHVQKHQVNPQIHIHHFFVFFFPRRFHILCTFWFFFLLNRAEPFQCVFCRLMVTDCVTLHPNLMLSNVDPVDASSDFSLFEALKETIYSEVATLISQNESRPHFLIELFHELQLLNTDYLRQRALYSLQVKKKS